MATAVEALWEGTELEPSPDVAKGSNNKSDKEIPVPNGHGAEEQGGCLRGLVLKLSALTKTQVLSTGDVTHG